MIESEHLTTPKPKTFTRFEAKQNKDLKPLISVVVSLYNYRNFIIDTLDTIVSQTLQDIELVIVDDASEDEGQILVDNWIKKNFSRFLRIQFLQHEQNGGLAAARNTGFQNSISSWVWVQDADNPLSPRALEQCYEIANQVHSDVAVVHPLLLTTPEALSTQVFQGEGRIWQQLIFKRANSVDAMALVRRIAWEGVGGYVHIPGGWEDYDFWCLLIDAGWTGVHCPQALASYTYHQSSMTKRSVLPNVRRLESLLQRRHPWLNCVGQTSGFLES